MAARVRVSRGSVLCGARAGKVRCRAARELALVQSADEIAKRCIDRLCVRSDAVRLVGQFEAIGERLDVWKGGQLPPSACRSDVGQGAGQTGLAVTILHTETA